MTIELNVRFRSSDRFAIKFGDRDTAALEFKAPVNDGDRAEIRWYLESYAAQYMTDIASSSNFNPARMPDAAIRFAFVVGSEIRSTF